MADNLIFQIGFDLETAVNEAGQQWDRKYAKKLEDYINKHTVKVNLDFESLADVKTRLAQLKIEPITPENRSAIKELVRELKELARIMEKVQNFKGIQLPELQAAKAAKLRKDLAQADEKLRLSQERVRQAQERLTLAQKKAEAQAYMTRDAYKSQDGYISRLLKRMAVYAGYSMSIGFLTSVREVTAQFELQRISLGAIIQDQQKANQIFAEIKSFALTSPLKILDLTKYAKQVAAYGFAADRVFDVTKRLADISVGLGVDMGRLTLAVSQIKAATVLKSSELRQLTETGLPMLDLLSKKLTETQGKLVSAADVMDLISKRAISYEMVEEILYDLTDAGGMFYNMQIKQSQTLFGMWSKLGDAAAIMYDQIGNTSSINAGMKAAIRSLELMMRNWKTTARVLDSVAVATTVYVVALKNATIASKATTIAEAARLAITNKQVIATPKLVASIIGQNTATKLSATLTKAHTAAMIRQSTATNVLSRGFWKLTAAMLANPWVAAAAAIAGVVAAIIHFTGNAETAAERTEKLNESIASLKNLEDTTKPLIDTYNELINKTERTAEEQKKLSEVTYELAKQYPGAITAVGNFGAEVELAADKLNQLYQAEKKVRLETIRSELSQTEKEIKKVQTIITNYQKQLESGTKTVFRQIGGVGQVEDITLTDQDKAKIIKRIDELRGNLNELEQSANDARRSLGLIPSEAAQAIEKFGAWKKKLTEFNKEVGGIKVRLFDDSTIEQFGTLEQALDATAKKYKEAAESVETNKRTLERGVAGLGQEQFGRITAERDEAQAMKELSEEALNYYNAMALLLKVMGGSRGGRTSDPRLGILQEMVSSLKQINKEYDELAKKEGATKALAGTQKVYAETFRNMQQLASKYKFDLPAFTVPTDTASLTKYLNSIREAMKKLPKSDKAVLALQVDIEKLDIDAQQKKIEKQLKTLADRISRTKTAKEFYEKILSQTGSRDIASRLATSIFGEKGDALNREIADRLRQLVASTSATLPDFVFNADMSVNTKALRGWVEANKDALGDTAKELTKFADESEKDTAKMVEGWLKATEKAKTFGDKLTDVYRRTATEISRIEAEMAKGTISRPEGTGLIAAYRRKEAEDIAKLQYEAFKDSPLYVQMFDDLDHASTRMLENMKSRLISMQSAWRNLDPTQLKELQSRLREIDEQLARRNPFKVLTDSLRKYTALRTKGDSRGRKTRADADRDAAEWAERNIKAQEELAQIKDDPAATEAQIAGAKRMVDYTQREKEEAERVAESWKKVEDAIGLSSGEIFGMLGSIGDAARSIARLTETFGGSEEDVQYWNDIADALGEVTSGLQNLVDSILSLNLAGIVSSIVTAVPNMIVGFANLFSAGKVRRANKEIKRQQELLDQLEYTYSRLEQAEERVFGSDYISNYNQQLKVLQTQATAYQRQAEAERSKGKKKDKAKVKEYENAYRDTMDRIADMQANVSARMYGSDLTSAARDFATAWLDAYREFGNTADALSDKFREMIQNMVVESLLGKVMEKALEPAFKLIDNMDTADFYDPTFWERVNATANQAILDADRGASVMMKFLQNAGISMRQTADGYTGIKRDIATATEESINGLAAGIDTQNYYISRQLTEVSAIRQLIEQGLTPQSAAPAAGWTDWQQQAMDAYNLIARNTADAVVECRRAAAACEEHTLLLRRVIAPRGGARASHGIQVLM